MKQDIYNDKNGWGLHLGRAALFVYSYAAAAPLHQGIDLTGRNPNPLALKLG